MTTQLLRPASSINDLRTQIHLALGHRLQTINLAPLMVRTITSAPASAQPYLLWELDIWNIAPALLSFGVSYNTILQNALYIHRFMGTPYVISYVLGLCGYSEVTLYEGQTSFGGNTYPATSGWAVFRIGIGPTVPNVSQLANIVQIVNFLKPARCVFDGVVGLTLTFSDDETPTVAVAPNAGPNNYQLAQGPAPTNQLKLYLNGLAQTYQGDYNLNGNIIQFVNAPVINNLLAYYVYGTPLVNTYYEYLGAQANGTAAVTLSRAPSPTASLEIYRNGAFLKQGVDYTYASQIVTFVSTEFPQTGDNLIAYYRNGTDARLGSIQFADNETPAHVSGNTYTVLSSPAPPSSLRIFRNGGLLAQGAGLDYTVTGLNITMNLAIQPSDVLTAFYRH